MCVTFVIAVFLLSAVAGGLLGKTLASDYPTDTSIVGMGVGNPPSVDPTTPLPPLAMCHDGADIEHCVRRTITNP